MTTVTLPRATVEQVLEALEDWDSPMALPAVVALRAALAQQAESPCACWPGRMCSRQAQCAADVREQQAEPVRFLIEGNEFLGPPPAPYSTWGDALDSMIGARAIQGLRISALAQQAYTDDLNQRKPLTQEEIPALAEKAWTPSVYCDAEALLGTDGLVALVRAVEAKHGIKE